jgi:hypothetical protein
MHPESSRLKGALLYSSFNSVLAQFEKLREMGTYQSRKKELDGESSARKH